MGQKGFFDVERRLEAISAKGDPLETIKKVVPWEDFRADIEAVTETKPEQRKSNAGRKPCDAILKFKIVVLQSLGPEGEGLAEPSPAARRTQPPAVRAPEGGEHDAREGARPCRARIRPAAERAGRSDRANDRHGAGARQDRLAESGLQHSPPGDAGTARRGMKVVELSAVFQPKQRAEKGKQ